MVAFCNLVAAQCRGDSVLSWLIEQLPLIQCCQSYGTSCSTSTRNPDPDLHSHVAGTTPSNDSSGFLGTAKCQIRSAIFPVGSAGRRHSLCARARQEASVGADIQMVSARRTLILSCRREASQTSYPYFNILGDRHGSGNDRVDICVQGHVFFCSLD